MVVWRSQDCQESPCDVAESARTRKAGVAVTWKTWDHEGGERRGTCARTLNPLNLDILKPFSSPVGDEPFTHVL